MWTGETDFQEQRPIILGFRANPPRGEIADEVVRLHVGIKFPIKRPETITVIGPLPIEFALLLDEPASPQSFVPLVEIPTFFQVTVFVLDDVAFGKPERRVVGIRVHLADVHGAVAAVLQVFDPRMSPTVGVLEDAGRVGIIPGEQAGPRRSTRGGTDMAIRERGAFVDQAVDVRRIDVVRTERTNGIKPLLVGDDEDDIRSVIRHGEVSRRYDFV